MLARSLVATGFCLTIGWFCSTNRTHKGPRYVLKFQQGNQITEAYRAAIGIPGGSMDVESGSSMDEAKTDTLHAMIDFTKEYGVDRRAK